MPQLDSKSSQIAFKQLGGLDERKAPYAQDGYDFYLLQGLYPAQDGLLERIPGRQFLANVNGYAAADTNPIQVFNISQTNDGSGNIIVQTNQDLRVYTLNELLGREPEESLEGTSIDDEDSATMALIVHRESNGTNAGPIGAVDDTFYARKLTDMIVNQGGTVSAFRDYSVPDPNQFDLTAGTYRISTTTVFCHPMGGYSSFFMGSVTALYNVTDSAYEVYQGGSLPIVSTSGFLDKGQRNEFLRFDAQFTISGTKTYELRQAAKSNGGGTDIGNQSTSGGQASGVTAGSNSEYYCFIKIYKMP